MTNNKKCKHGYIVNETPCYPCRISELELLLEYAWKNVHILEKERKERGVLKQISDLLSENNESVNEYDCQKNEQRVSQDKKIIDCRDCESCSVHASVDGDFMICDQYGEIYFGNGGKNGFPKIFPVPENCPLGKYTESDSNKQNQSLTEKRLIEDDLTDEDVHLFITGGESGNREFCDHGVDLQAECDECLVSMIGK